MIILAKPAIFLEVNLCRFNTSPKYWKQTTNSNMKKGAAIISAPTIR